MAKLNLDEAIKRIGPRFFKADEKVWEFIAKNKNMRKEVKWDIYTYYCIEPRRRGAKKLVN